MQIPAFPLPSNMTKLIYFRVPTVDDGLMFCDLIEGQEEANTTLFLNHLQDAEKAEPSDSATWTGEDRRTALWWIFMSTSELRTIPFRYYCDLCDKDHYLDLQMDNLMETAIALPELPEKSIKFYVQGKGYEANVNPINGYGAEYLESLRNQRDQFEEDSLEWKKASNDMALAELALCLTFEQQPEDPSESLAWKLERIKSMHLKTEFQNVSAMVELALREMRHGLLTKYSEGRYYLVAEVANCEEVIKKGGSATRPLLLPFRNNDFIATF